MIGFSRTGRHFCFAPGTSLAENQVRLIQAWFVTLVLVSVLLLVGCGGQPSMPQGALPPAGDVTDWSPVGEVQVFEPESLYDLVNGQADAFYAYGFERVAVQTYENEQGLRLRVEVWQVATPADAYGLLSTIRAGIPVAIGNGGDSDPGRRLDFWQNQFMVRLFAPQALDDGDLQAMAGAVASALPAGGERPDLVNRLPQDGLVARSDLFFHEEISIQNILWLGGQNTLGLSSETEGLLSRYELPGGQAFLLLVRYPGDEAAAVAWSALQSGPIDGLIVAQVRGDLLGAVFGAAGEADASALLEAALGAE